MSTVLVTGANGFIGSAVLPLLRAESPDRSIIVAGRNGDASAVPQGCRHAPLDLAASHLLPAGIDTVLHLAGEKRDPSRMPAVNHLGPVYLVEAAAHAGAKRFVHLSSVGVYGVKKHGGMVDESGARTPHNPYEASKNAGELAVRERCAALGLSCVVLQPSTVIGVVAGRSYPLLGLARMVARGWFRHVGRGDAWVNYVAVEDVAAALAAATRDDMPAGLYIVNTPAPLRELVAWMAEELGVPAPEKHLPLWVGAAAAMAGAVGRALLRRELPFSPERFLELTNTTRYDGNSITDAAGFAYPLGIERALRGMIRQYRHQGLV
jgi:nucleoside-diphosphate-sugar epimerase